MLRFVFTRSMFLALLMFSGQAQAAPIGQLPAFACNGSPERCFELASATIRSSMIPFDALEPSMDVSGHSQYVLEPYRTHNVLITFHGLYEDAKQFAPEIENLVSQGPLNVLDLVLPGHGATNAAADQVNYLDWIGFMHSAITLAHALGDQVIILGQSTGGMLGLIGSLEFPEFVRGVMMIEPAVRMQPLTEQEVCYGEYVLPNLAKLQLVIELGGYSMQDFPNANLWLHMACEVSQLRHYLAKIEHGHPDDLALTQLAASQLRIPVFLVNNVHDLITDHDHTQAMADVLAEKRPRRLRYDEINLDGKSPHGLLTVQDPGFYIHEINAYVAEFFPDFF